MAKAPPKMNPLSGAQVFRSFCQNLTPVNVIVDRMGRKSLNKADRDCSLFGKLEAAKKLLKMWFNHPGSADFVGFYRTEQTIHLSKKFIDNILNFGMKELSRQGE
jgi:hypothetical protein